MASAIFGFHMCGVALRGTRFCDCFFAHMKSEFKTVGCSEPILRPTVVYSSKSSRCSSLDEMITCHHVPVSETPRLI